MTRPSDAAPVAARWPLLPGADAADPRLTQFLRGLTMGALVGAAIAGSAIWGRRSRRMHPHGREATGGATAGRVQPDDHPPSE
jgi:hypothetical protein